MPRAIELSEEKQTELQNAENYLRSLADGLRLIREDGKDQKAIARLFGMSDQNYGRNIKKNFVPFVKAGHIIKQEYAEEIYQRLASPTDKMLAVILEDDKPYFVYPEYDEAKFVETVEKILPGRDFQIISMRFGLDGNGERTLEEIGDHFLLTRERVRQIILRCLKKLRYPSVLWQLIPKYICDPEQMLEAESEIIKLRAQQEKNIEELIEAKRELECVVQSSHSEEILKEASILLVRTLQELGLSDQNVKKLVTQKERRRSNVIGEIDLSCRTLNCLSRACTKGSKSSIDDVIHQFPTISDLKTIRNMGAKSIAEFVELAADYGYNYPAA